MYNIELCKVGEEDGCVYQDKDDKMVMTVIFLVLEWIPKKGGIFQGSPKVRSGNGKGSVPGLSLLPFNPSLCQLQLYGNIRRPYPVYNGNKNRILHIEPDRADER